MPKHSATIQINASTDKVWELVSNGSRLSDWLSPVRGVDTVEPDGPLEPGSKLEATLGNVGGAKINIKKAERGRLLHWSAGPFLAHMMRMPMFVDLELEPRGDSTQATITFRTNPMIAPIMKMMTGLNFSEEAPNTVQKLKQAVESS